MVYHHPAERPAVHANPVKRLYSSDAAAAKFFRYTVGTASVVTGFCLGSALVSALCLPTGWKTMSKAALGASACLFVCAAPAGVAVYCKWDSHVRPNTAIQSEYEFYRATEDAPSSDASAKDRQTPGVALVTKVGKYLPSPKVAEADTAKRAFNTVGMSIIAFFTMEFTLSLEYAFTSCARIFRHSFSGALGWYEPISATTRARLYQAVLNTTLVCFTRTCRGDMDADLGVDVGGHVVFENVCLPFGDKAHCKFRKIAVFMNHETCEVERLVLVRDKPPSGAPAMSTWGSRRHEDNTDSERISAEESLHQVGLILLATAAFYTHGMVHRWAAGVSSLAAWKWAGAAESTRATQWTNTQAVMSAWFFIGNSVETMAAMLTHNTNNGFPVHGVAHDSGADEITLPQEGQDGSSVDAPLFAVLGKRSSFHQLTTAAKGALEKHFGQGADPMEAHSIVTASVMHGLEHYMLGELLPAFSEHSQCIALQTDLSGLLQCLVYPVGYVSRPFLNCRFRFWDTVSLTIHRACAARGKELAAANREAKAKGEVAPFAPVQSFCDWYIHVGCSV